MFAKVNLEGVTAELVSITGGEGGGAAAIQLLIIVVFLPDRDKNQTTDVLLVQSPEDLLKVRLGACDLLGVGRVVLRTLR